MKRLAYGICLLLWASLSSAVDPLPFADQKQEKRFQSITEQLRCLQCQNQNLADSDAGLAKDMRAAIYGGSLRRFRRVHATF
jgi:cytochrome c-type biogenesis protein CcmH